MESTEEIKSSQAQFSQIVKAVDVRKEDKTASGYRFSNGRRFESGNGAYEPEA